jgi:hypothetical protein
MQASFRAGSDQRPCTFMTKADFRPCLDDTGRLDSGQ